MLQRRLQRLAWLFGTCIVFGCGGGDEEPATGLPGGGALADGGDGAAAFGGQSGAGGGAGGVLPDASLDVDIGDAPTDGVYIVCGTYGQACTGATHCCSGLCNPNTNTCDAAPTTCSQAGTSCALPTDCCTFNCTGGFCSTTHCTADNEACAGDAGGTECCSQKCTNNLCAPLSTSCRSSGNPCTSESQCCSGLCKDGFCQAGASYCIQTGDACARATDCCGGVCEIAAGATIGTCRVPNVGGVNCSGAVDGTLCSGCNSCCSRLCAPYGPTGVYICQPANGCHITGDLCRTSADCCGAPGTGLPGDGNVECVYESSGDIIGVCRNPRSCNPEGNVCHFKYYACDNSSARNDCCAGTGNSGVCQVDQLGVPRCYGLGDACRQPGETCSSTMDCCNDVPCVPDSAGVLRCLIVPDGGPVCSPFGGYCTIDADCCPGYTCIRPIGSTQGTCGIYTQPTPDAGVPDGAPPSDAQPPPPDAKPCSLYGQNCSVTADCCSGVPCTGGKCVIPPP